MLHKPPSGSLSLPQSIPKQSRGAEWASYISYFHILRRREGRNSAARACRCKFSLSIFASDVSLPCALRIKSKYMLKEAVGFLVTLLRGAGVEESRKAPKLVFRAEDVGADK